jgi:hypothetical protein
MSYLPSVLATATMVHVFNSVEPSLGDEYQIQLLGILGINKVSVFQSKSLYRRTYGILILILMWNNGYRTRWMNVRS